MEGVRPTSMYSFQCHLRLIHNLTGSVPSATKPSWIIWARNTTVDSSSRWPGMSIVTSTQSCSPSAPASSSSPFNPLGSAPTPSIRTSLSSPALEVLLCWVEAETVFWMSAFTPTIPSVPSAKQTRALPLVDGSRSVSAVRGRNVVGERASGRSGGLSESDEWR